MTLTSVLSAGVGIHFWTYSLPEKRIHHPGIGLALGLQARMNDQWILGVHVLHPRAWNDTSNGLPSLAMILSVGCSYSFFRTATMYSDLHMEPGKRIQWGSGIEWTLRNAIGLMLGIHNYPLTWSAGLTLLHQRCELQIAFQYVTDAGIIPSTSIYYAW
jgi:hypothetical protein